MNLISKQDPFMREFFNHTIGFDNLFNRLSVSKEPTFPPYNITREGKETFVELALAGYSKDNISVTVQDSMLTIEGSSNKSPLSERQDVHRGIASRKFKRTFSLGEHVEVKSAGLENGLLTITLEEVIPEEKQPKVININ